MIYMGWVDMGDGCPGKIQNKDIGFVEPGMPAEIKIQTFPFTQYGIIEATVKTITDDALADQENGLIFTVHLIG